MTSTYFRSALHLRRRRSLRMEALETRWAPPTFAVTSAADSGAGSLRDAIAQSNARAGYDEVVFSAGLVASAAVCLSAVHTDGCARPASASSTLPATLAD